MSYRKISDMSAADSLDGTESVEIATTGNESKRCTTQQIADLGGGGFSNPMTAVGDLIIGGADGAPTRLPKGTNGQFVGYKDGTLAAIDGGSGGSSSAPVVIQLALSDEITDIVAGTQGVTFRTPFAFTLTEVRASLSNAGAVATTVVELTLNGTSVFSTQLSIDTGEKTSVTAATPAVLSTTAIPDDAEFIASCVSSSSGAKGLKVTLIGTKP